MAFERPKLTTLVDRIRSDAESRYGKRVMRRSLLSVLSTVCAGVAHGLYGYIEYVMRQTFSSTAEGVFLERRASEYGISRKAATYATGTVVFSGSAVIPEGTLLQNDDDVQYSTLADGEPGVDVEVQAVEAGESGNLDAGVLSLVNPVEGISSEADCSEMVGGVDAETDESLRERLLYRQKNPPKAGTAEDGVNYSQIFSLSPKRLILHQKVAHPLPKTDRKRLVFSGRICHAVGSITNQCDSNDFGAASGLHLDLEKQQPILQSQPLDSIF